MATFYFYGTVSDSLTAAGNYSGGVAPTGATTDTIVVAATAVRGILSNVVQPTWDIASLRIESGFRHNVGSSTSKFTMAAATVYDFGDGDLWLDADGPAGADIDKVVINKGSLAGRVYLYDSGDEIPIVDVKRGVVHYRCDSSTSEVNLSYRDFVLEDATVIVDPSSAPNVGIQTFTVNGGLLRMDPIAGGMASTTMVGYVNAGVLDTTDTTWLTILQTGGVVIPRRVDLENASGILASSIYHGIGGVFDVTHTPATISGTTLRKWTGWQVLDQEPTKYSFGTTRIIGQ